MTKLSNQTKFYLTDGSNRFVIDTSDHIEACIRALKHWEDSDKDVGDFICFNEKGFDSIKSASCLETNIIKGFNYTNNKIDF